MIQQARTLFAAVLLTMASFGAAFAFGAIAVDDYYEEPSSEAGYGVATEYRNARQAAAAALEACNSHESSDCKVVLTFRRCGAYASSRGSYGVGTANTLKEAEERALRHCGQPTCILVVSDCSK